MANKILALDVGTSSVKAGLWDGKRIAARVRVEYATQYPAADRAEIPAERILQAVVRAGKEVLRGTKRIDAVSFCALSSAVVVTDEKGKVRLGAITHQDRRSVKEAAGLVERFGKKWLLAHTGNLPYPGGVGSSTLAWIHRHVPGRLRGKCRVGQMSSLIGDLLTGEWVIDPSQAVFLGLWDIGKRAWNADICAAVGVKIDSLPVMKWADEVSGYLTPALAKCWGVAAGVPVVGGFVDTSAAILPTAMKPGQLIHNTGSTDVLALCVEEPRPEEGILCRPVGVGKVFPKRWLAVRTIAAAGSAFAWARETLFPTLTDAAWVKLLRAACEKRNENLSVKCIPDFAGRRAAIGQGFGAAFWGLALSSRREDLLAAIAAGLVQESGMNYHMLANIHRPLKAVYAMGSGKDLARAMHAVWDRGHRFVEMEGDSFMGLVMLAERVAK